MFESIILIVMAILFLIILPILASIKYWNYKYFMKYVLMLMWVSYGVIAYEVINPRDSFYNNHLKDASNIPFSDDSKLIYKYTSLLDTKGKYAACAVIELNHKDSQLLNNTTLIYESKAFNFNTLIPQCKQEIAKHFNVKNVKIFKKIDEKHLRIWGYIPMSNKAFVVYRFLGTTEK